MLVVSGTIGHRRVMPCPGRRQGGSRVCALVAGELSGRANVTAAVGGSRRAMTISPVRLSRPGIDHDLGKCFPTAKIDGHAHAHALCERDPLLLPVASAIASMVAISRRTALLHDRIR
jgi:hypothetical protein